MTNPILTDDYLYDITIIGGGPTGLFAAFYGGMRKCSVKIIESMPQLGGQLAALYPEKYIYDIAGFPKVLGQELVDNLVKQAKYFDPAICLDEKVTEVEQVDEYFKLKTQNGTTHLSKTIIITAGVGAFQPRKLRVPNAEQFEDTNLHYFVTDLQSFQGKRVLIAGGGDSAVDWALMLEPIANEVTLVHRRDRFRAHEHSVENLRKSNVKIMTPKEIGAMKGTDRIEKVALVDRESKEMTKLEVDAVIVNYGFVSSLGPIQEWGLDIEKGSIHVNTKMETNIPGIYAAGDITTYPGKVKLIATGFGEAPTAVNNALQFINPKAKLQPMHSSDMKF